MSPRISMWQNGKYGQDSIWFDRHISESFTMGGVGMGIWKYLGAANPNVTNDATQPQYPNMSAQNIQDLLFLENRDRKYSKDAFILRGHYNVAEIDLALSNFGLFIDNGSLYVTFHLKDMVDTIGRKLMSGDVLEFFNLKEFYNLDETVPVALKRYYVVQEASRSAIGFDAQWWSHLWRVKCNPMVDSQEFSDILNKTVIGLNGKPVLINGNTTTYSNITSSLDTYLNIGNAIVSQAAYNTPESGYNTDALWSPIFVDGNPKKGVLPANSNSSPEQKFTGYLVGNGEAIDGYPVTSATAFPTSPNIGDYILRTDYFPARLYRYSNNHWQFVNSDVRSPLTNGLGIKQTDQFINNSNTFINSANITIPVLQPLNELFRPDKGGTN